MVPGHPQFAPKLFDYFLNQQHSEGESIFDGGKHETQQGKIGLSFEEFAAGVGKCYRSSFASAIRLLFNFCNDESKPGLTKSQTCTLFSLTFTLAFGHEKTENNNDHSSGKIGMAQANALFRLKKTSTATTLFRQGLANTPTAATITNTTAEIPTQQEQSLDFMELSKWCSAHAPALHKTLHSFITSR